MKKLLTCGLLLLVGCIAAQTTTPNHFPPNRFLVYNTTDGLPGNIIYDIAMDKDGFVWVGTNNGLGRYDGQRFMAFKDLIAFSDMPQSRIASIFADSHHSLWVRFNNQAIYCINLETYKVRFINNDYSEHNIDFKPNFVEDIAGNVWFNDSKRVVKWQWADKKFIVYPFSEYLNKNIISICKGGEDYLWVATRGGIYRFDTQKHTYEREQQLLNFDEKVRALSTDDAGNLWFSNWYNMEAGIVCYDPKQQQILHKVNKQMISPSANTDAFQILSLGKMVWFGTNSSGLIAFDTENNGFNIYNPDSKNPLSIQSETAFSVQNDQQGNLWLGTVNGLHLLQAHRKDILLLAHHPFNPNSLISPIATSAYNLDERRVALGTFSGLSIYDRIDKSFKNIKLPQYNGNDYNNKITAFESGENGSFWVGTWSGLFRLDKNTGSILEYYITFGNAGDKHPESVKRLNVGAMKNLYKDKKGILWFINQEMQLGRMMNNSQARVFEMIKTIVQDGDENNDFANCFLESDAYLFIGTENGLVQYDYSNNTFQLLPITFLDNKGGVSIKNLELSAGFLLATVNGKPYKINLAKREATPLLKSGNEQKYRRIIEDTPEGIAVTASGARQQGGIWMDTENGLLKTDINGEASVFYDSKHYLNDNTFQRSDEYRIDKDADGNLYFGGSKGFTVIQPKEMLYHAPKPDVKITSIRYNNKPIELGEAIHLTQSIKLPYAQRSFSLQFSALGSTIPELNQFAYRLNNEQWVQLDNQSNVNFSNLEPGTYHLQVKAANSDGIWNEEGARLTITILPPWYRSWLAWLVYLGALGYGIYKYYLYQLQRKIEHTETQRLKELDTIKTSFFANVSHELRTPLTLILAPLSTMLKSDTLDNKNFTLASLVRQNAQGLLRLVNEILDLNKLEAGKMTLHEEPVVGYNLIRRIIANFESHAERQNIRFTFNYEPDKYLQLSLDTNKFEKIINNLMSNALKFTPTKGAITVTVKDLHNRLQIEVMDTGRGIHPDDMPHVFNRFYQTNQPDAATEGGTGIGLSLSMELAKLMKGTLSVESNLGNGSTFYFTLPKKEILGTISTTDALEMQEEVLITEGGVSRDLTLLNEGISLENNAPTILVVEDNLNLRDYLTLVLKSKYHVLTAENGQVALRIMKGELGIRNEQLGIRDDELGLPNSQFLIPNLILSDVMMPIMDGFQLLTAIKSDVALYNIPVVMLTARAEMQDKLKALRIGVDDYLIKPFEEEELLVRLENLLKNAQHRKIVQQESPISTINEAADENDITEIPPLSIDDLAWLSDLENVIRQHIGDYNLSTDRIADMLHISRSQFYRRVRLLTGLTPIQYLQEVRFNHARLLLEQRSVNSVKSAAAAVGMRQVQNFSQHFKKRFGKLPSDYLS